MSHDKRFMSESQSQSGSGVRRNIIHLSDLQAVSMGETWFEMARLDHFWVERRFQVLLRLWNWQAKPKLTYCEVGCGHGILQRQLELELGISVDGFDLCLNALEKNQSHNGILYYYDVFDRRTEIKEKYDVLFLFDVLEHIDQDLQFLEACLYHVSLKGHVVINVPARMELFSKYDQLAGHVRRYTIKSLLRLARSARLETCVCTYWGLPFYPLLLTRKILLTQLEDAAAFERGFKPPNQFANLMLKILARLELLPQRFLGTSIMAVLQKS